VGSQDRRIR
jgi:hypothetical protein